MTDKIESIAYLAGMVDGEGCVSLSCCYGDKKRVFAPRLRISGVDEAHLRGLQTEWGGYVGRNGIPKNPRHKQAYYWLVARRQSIEILKTILPFLRLKRRQAEIACEYHSLNTPRIEPTPELAERRAILRAELANLNQRGPKTQSLGRETLSPTICYPSTTAQAARMKQYRQRRREAVKISS